MAKLVFREGRNAGTEYVIPPSAERVLLGRSSGADIQVLDPQSSREHVELLIDGSTYLVRDLGSSNGTYVDGQRITGLIEFGFGRSIRIGSTTVELVDDSGELETLKIPGHQVIGLIGSGGMGTVYKARQLSMDRLVALKILHRKYAHDRQFIERFVREARSAGRLGHPNVVHVNDVGEHDGIHYFSMEFVDGITIKQLLKQKGRLEVDEAIDVAIQAAKALSYAHENGIIHRDVKPDNLMRNRDGIVKIADLGIAKSFEESSVEDTSKKVFGTPHYMAPEQALGKDVDRRADVYSLGATLYHLLTGSTPFHGATITEVLKAHVRGELPPIREKAPETPTALVHIVERMMARDPDKRYLSMRLLIDDLERVQSDRNARIEGLAAGESSIVSDIVSRFGGAKSSSGRHGTRVLEPVSRGVFWRRMLLPAGGLLVLALLFAGAMTLTRRMKTDTPAMASPSVVEPRQEPVSPPRDLFEDLKRLEAEGKLEEAVEEAKRLFAALKDDKATADQATRAIERLELARSARREASAAKDLEQASVFASDNPDDLQGQLERFRQVAAGHKSTAAARKAAEAAGQVEAAMTRLAAEEARRDFAEVTREVQVLATDRRYDEAFAALKAFLERRPDSAEAVSARRLQADLETALSDAYAAAVSECDKMMAAERYSLATAPLARFIEANVAEAWRGQARRKIAEYDLAIAQVFNVRLEKIQKKVIAFDYDEALIESSLVASRFGETRWSEVLQTRLLEIKAEQALFYELIDRIGASRKPTALPFSPPGMPETGGGSQWTVHAASRRVLTVAAGSSAAATRGVAWKDLTPAQLVQLFEVFFPEPTREQSLALAYLCQRRGLDEKAQEHFNAAAQTRL